MINKRKLVHKRRKRREKFRRFIRLLLPIFFVNDDIEYKPHEVINALKPKYRTWRKRSIVFVISTLFLIAVIVGSIAKTFFSSDISTFSVNVATEQANLETVAGAMSGWVFDNTELSVGCPSDDEERQETEIIAHFNGKVSVKPGVNVHFSRVEFGDFNVRLFSEQGEAVAEIEAFDHASRITSEISDCMLIRVSNITKRSGQGKNLVLPLTGNIDSGKEIRFSETSTTPLLRGGEVSILDKKLLTEEHYVVGPFALALGDFLTIDKEVNADGASMLTAQGFLVIDHNPAMRLVYRDRGKRAVIHRYQMQAEVISNGALNRLLNDSFLSLLWVLVVGVYFVNRELLRYMVEE